MRIKKRKEKKQSIAEVWVRGFAAACRSFVMIQEIRDSMMDYIAPHSTLCG
jgi:hypothetical protein